MSDQTIPLPLTATCPPSPFPFFREYIGPKSTNTLSPITFSEVPNLHSNVHFHFILSFARDYDDNNCPTNGNFKPHWNQAKLSPQEVKDIKAKHQNVQAVLGIGGREYGRFPFDPSGDYDSWIRNAAVTIQKIIDDYCLDGVEVNYESINVGKDDFAYCIGELIKKLKESKPDAYYVSIAPSADVQAHYRDLYEKYSDYIDMVDYQIYTHHPQTVEDFVQLYRCQKKIYRNLLVGLSTDIKDLDLQQGTVFEVGSLQLKSAGELQGIFIWSADDSKNVLPLFAFEIYAQGVLYSPAS